MANDDKFGEGSNYFSSFKVGGVKGNIYGRDVKGAPNPGVKIEPTLDDKGKQLYDDEGFPRQNIILEPSFIDGSDALANKGFTVSFQSVIKNHCKKSRNFCLTPHVTNFNHTPVFSKRWNH